jgi:hypothetical protein
VAGFAAGSVNCSNNQRPAMRRVYLISACIGGRFRANWRRARADGPTGYRDLAKAA